LQVPPSGTPLGAGAAAETSTMHGNHAFLEALTMVLCVAVVTSLVFRRLHLPVVLGYIMAGLIIGPHLPVPLVADEAVVQQLSDLGVILLMFALGLEFSLRKLLSVGPTASVTAVIQCSAMIWLGFVTGQALGWTTAESVFAGAIIAISSTTIIAKTFDELGVRGSLRELVVGVLIVEDLIAILLMAVLTAVYTGAGVSADLLVSTTVRLVVFLLALVAIGLAIIPRSLRAIAARGESETLLLASIAICCAISLLADRFGYSVALGAFIAGSLVAESGQERIIEPLIHPLRDLFAAIFFVSVGMIIDPGVILEQWQAVVAVTAVAIVGKFVSVSLGALLAGSGIRLAVRSGMSLAQIGEFSFIIAGLGLSLGVTREAIYSIAVAVSAITTLTTPLLVRVSDPVAHAVERRAPRRVHTFVALYRSWLESMRSAPRTRERGAAVRSLVVRLVLDVALLVTIAAVIALNTRAVVEMMNRHLGLPEALARLVLLGAGLALASPFALGLVRLTQRLGAVLAESALEAARQGQLDLAAAPRNALAATLQLIIASIVGTTLLALTQPFLPGPQGIFVLVVVAMIAAVLWRRVTDLEGHVRAGAEMIVEALIRQTAARDSPSDPLQHVRGFLPGLGAPEPFAVPQASPAVGKTLGELNLSGTTDATVLAVIRDGRGVVAPSTDEVVHANDVFVLAGSRDAVSAAKLLLGADGAQPPAGHAEAARS
jgi:CPA2 family monovalent cation:H+ antiporter-2